MGDGDSDHYCWQRPEDMTTSRQAYRIDANHPGSDLAGETAAAMAAASIVFSHSNPSYANELLTHAQQVLYSLALSSQELLIVAFAVLLKVQKKLISCPVLNKAKQKSFIALYRLNCSDYDMSR